MTVSKIQNGVLRNIIVPGEHAYRGWYKFKRCIDSFFNKSSRSGNVQSSLIKKEKRHEVEYVAIEKGSTSALKS